MLFSTLHRMVDMATSKNSFPGKGSNSKPAGSAGSSSARKEAGMKNVKKGADKKNISSGGKPSK